jgi:hypothetical protein
MSAKLQEIQRRRDAKAKPHLEQYAPVWITDEKLIDEDDALQFHAVFQHPQAGWVSRRYRYDGFNNVLYHKGQTTISEEQAIALSEAQAPYLNATVTDIPNAYGG